MKTHPELYEESLRLQDLVDEYKNKKDYLKLEKILLKLVKVYDGLNYCEEDDYLENIIDCYKELSGIYKQDNKKLTKCYEKIIENYDYLIQRDRSDSELLNAHIEGLKSIYNLYLKTDAKKDIAKEYPRLKEYIKE